MSLRQDLPHRTSETGDDLGTYEPRGVGHLTALPSKGALVFVAVAVAALMGTISTGSCAQERYPRRSLTRLITGQQPYRPTRLSTCGFVRTITPEAMDVVPCQVWNLMPLTGLGAIAAGWLALDLVRRKTPPA